MVQSVISVIFIVIAIPNTTVVIAALQGNLVWLTIRKKRRRVVKIAVELSKEECEFILTQYVKKRLSLPVVDAEIGPAGCSFNLELGDDETAQVTVDTPPVKSVPCLPTPYWDTVPLGR